MNAPTILELAQERHALLSTPYPQTIEEEKRIAEIDAELSRRFAQVCPNCAARAAEAKAPEG